MRRVLHVVSLRRWIADDFAARVDDLDVRHSLGFDLPDLRPGDAIWAPTEWMARARRALADLALPDLNEVEVLPLADPGARFLARVPPEFLGRTVAFAPFEHVRHNRVPVPAEAFFKPANIKVERLPAAWRTRSEFVDAALEVGLHPGSTVMWSERYVRFVEEHRCFVLDGQVVTSSPYLIDGSTWHEQMTGDSSAAERFAQTILDTFDRALLPPTFVLDVGLVDDGSWIVVETNPVWSSAQYGADLGRVAECLFVANRPTADWWWRPDPYLVERARAQRLLGIELTANTSPRRGDPASVPHTSKA